MKHFFMNLEKKVGFFLFFAINQNCNFFIFFKKMKKMCEILTIFYFLQKIKIDTFWWFFRIKFLQWWKLNLPCLLLEKVIVLYEKFFFIILEELSNHDSTLGIWENLENLDDLRCSGRSEDEGRRRSKRARDEEEEEALSHSLYFPY